MDFIKVLKSLNSVSAAPLPSDHKSDAVGPVLPKRENEGPIYRPVSITLQVERHRLDLLKSKPHPDRH